VETVKRGIRYLQLLTLIQKLGERGLEDPELRKLARRVNRSLQLVVYDEYGTMLAIWIGVENGELVVKNGTYPATNTLRIHIDALIDILKGEIDFREAVLHGVAELESHDAVPWFYHFALWCTFFKKVRQILA
jgi:hypothetical protein